VIGATRRLAERLVVYQLRREDARRRARSSHNRGELHPTDWGLEIAPDGNLRVQGVPLTTLACEYGTPLHVLHVPWLRRSHEHFIAPFRAVWPQTRLATSYKTNPVPEVLRTLHGLGTWAEVISEFELWLAERLDVPPEHIIVNGPGKTGSMLERAVSMGVRMINIDGAGEIENIAKLAQRAGRKQSVGVRVVTSVGWASQFGLSIASGDARRAFEAIRRQPWLDAKGIHLHIGTGLKSVSSYLAAIDQVVALLQELSEELEIDIDCIDLGGGYGVPTVRSGDSWDDRMIALGYPAREAIVDECPGPADYAEGMARVLAKLPGKAQERTLVLEPGRAITSAAQTLLLSVVAIKSADNTRQIILDGGKNITMPLAWESHKIFPTRIARDAALSRADLFGPLCHPGDIVARHLDLPTLKVGDVLAIMDAGAYFIPNQMNFSNPRPAIVAVEGGTHRLVRRRESFDDIVRLDMSIT